jgi:S1-C subfamily serine protease
MPLERHHKIILGGLTSLFIIVIIANSIFLYWVYTKEIMNYNDLSQKIEFLQNDTNSKFNELSNNLLTTKNDLKSLGLQVGSIDTQINQLKASVSADFSGIFEDSVKSVVTIKTDVAQGSGFFIDDGGYVVTNAHVMKGATAATIITYDGESHSVSRIGENPTMDIILLKIDDKGYEPLELGNSDNVQIGEKVIAIGNPYGLSFSVSQGIVSNIHQEGENRLKAYILTDTALNPGNSGGPLINVNGKIIGINNFKLSESEGLGFALESNYIKEIVNDISQQAYGKDLI